MTIIKLRKGYFLQNIGDLSLGAYGMYLVLGNTLNYSNKDYIELKNIPNLTSKNDTDWMDYLLELIGKGYVDKEEV